MAMKLSLNDKAHKANAQSRHCKNCPLNPCPRYGTEVMELCTREFVEGFRKGYKLAMKEIKISGSSQNMK